MRRPLLIRAPYSLGIDARSAINWRPSIGAVYYFSRHNAKISITERESLDAGGLERVRSRATYLQMQVIF